MFLSSFVLAADLSPDDPVLRALRTRDTIACARLPEVADRAETLYQIIQADAAPSLVPLRAAFCLTELYADDQRFLPWISPWFADPERGGLAMAVAAANPNHTALPALIATSPEPWRGRLNLILLTER